MIYKLKFLPSALKEWEKLDNSVKNQFKKKLSERLKNPQVASCRLHSFKNHYKIKLKDSGYRLVYEIIDNELCVLVIAVGKRDKGHIYQKAKKRIQE